MKYYVFVNREWSASDLSIFDTKGEALEYVGEMSGENQYCTLIEGTEILFSIKQIATERVEHTKYDDFGVQ